MIQLQSRFANGENIVEPARLLILEEELMTRSISEANPTKNSVFLFTDALLVTSTSYSGYLYRRDLLVLQSIVVMNRHDDGEEHSFWILAPMVTHIFRCPSAESKTKWMSGIADAISQIISQSPEMQKDRNRFVVRLINTDIPILIPLQADQNPHHPVWTELASLQSSSKGFFSSLWSWFSPSQ